MSDLQRLAIVSTMRGSPWGGSEELWAAAAKRALSKGMDVLISVPRWNQKPDRLAELEWAGARVIRRRSPVAWSGRLDAAWSRIRPPFADLAKFRPDVVCINQGSTFDLGLEPLLYPSFRESIAERTPYVIICHHNDNWPLTPVARARQAWAFENAYAVAFVAEANLRLAERQLARDVENARVLRNPVTLPNLSIVPWPQGPVPTFGCVARLDALVKGQDLLLEVFGAPRWRDREWHLRFYGTGEDEGYLRDLARYRGLEDRVGFEGLVTDVRAIWSDNQILVLASRAEGAPLALVEAMVCGRPAVATRVGGVEEWLADGRTGFVAEAPKVSLLAAALERAWEGRSAWEGMGAGAHEQAMARIDPDPGLTLLDLLGEAAASRR